MGNLINIAQKGADIMTCFLCKTSSIKDELTTFMVDLGDCIVIVKKVPSQVCGQCGETTYSMDVSRQLEKIVNSLRDSMMEIAVVNYSDQSVA